MSPSALAAPFETAVERTPLMSQDDNARPAAAAATALATDVPGDHGVDAKVNFLALCACLNSVALGYQIGAITVANPLVADALDLSKSQLTLYESLINVAAVFGALLASAVSEPLGRRMTFLASALCFATGSLVQALASSITPLFIGVSLVGLAVGLGLAVDPIYIAEISPAGHRGYFVTYSEIMIASGQMLGFLAALIITLIWPNWAGTWRLMLGLGIVVPAALVYAVVFIMPESPRWLAVHGRGKEAREVLLSLGYGEAGATKIMVAIAAEHAATPGTDTSLAGFVDDVLAMVGSRPALRRLLMVGVGVAVAQQISGNDAIFYNYVHSLRAVGVGEMWKIYATLVAFGVLKIGTAVVAMRLLDSVGRRPLLVFSGFATSLTLFALSLTFAWRARGNGAYQTLVVGLYYVYVVSFEIGLGPGCWLIPSEIFYNDIRMRAMSLATLANRCATLGVVGTAIFIQDAWAWSGYFAWFGSTCLVGALFLYNYLPETKGRSLEEMYAHFEKITAPSDLRASMLPAASPGLT